jgi:integrase
MASKTWKRTKVQFLWQNIHHGTYYARLFRDGKEHWKSLKTSVFSVAQAKLAVHLKDFRTKAPTVKTVEAGKATVEDLSKVYLTQVEKDQSIKSATVHYRNQIVASLSKTWPELKDLRPGKVTEADCVDWGDRYAKQYSPTRYNNAVDTVRGIFEVAIDQGLIYRNPAAKLKKRRPNRKHLDLPSSDKFDAIVAAVRNEGAWCSKQCGDLIEFLAYSGCRLDEAKNVKWADVEKAGIWVHGDAEHGTKGNERRFIPIIPPMAALLKDLRENPRYYRGEREGYVLAVSEAQKALTKACAAVGAKRLTHHDLRHLFATRCIESGVDIPTVARWLGHKDGGVLALKTYGHLRTEHSQAMAAKVTF